MPPCLPTPTCVFHTDTVVMLAAPQQRCNRNCKLEILTAPTKAKSRKPAYSQHLQQQVKVLLQCIFHKLIFYKLIFYQRLVHVGVFELAKFVPTHSFNGAAV